MHATKVHDVIGKVMQKTALPLVFNPEKSKGCYLWDDLSNKKLLDFHTSFSSQPLSYQHHGFNSKFRKIMNKYASYNPSNPDILTSEKATFVETFSNIAMPSGFNHLYLVAGGTRAVEDALKVAFDWKMRKGAKDENRLKVLHFKGAFHGRSGYCLSMTNTSDARKYMLYPKFDWPRVPFPDENNSEEEVKREIIDVVEKWGHEIAAICVEPIQCEGGDRHMSPEFWSFLRQITLKNDILLVCDEIQTGYTITGKFWCYEHLGAPPDVIAFGKKAQVCGLIATSRIDDVENVFKVPSRISSTFGDYISNMVRGQRILEIISEEHLEENAEVMGDYLKSSLENLGVPNVRGRGLLTAFDLASGIERDSFVKTVFHNGALILPCGEKSVRFRPFLDVDKSAIDHLHSILRRSLARPGCDL